VALQGPQPVAEVKPPAPAPQASAYDQLKAQLLARGVVWMRLDTSAETGEVKFACSVPGRSNPDVRRTFEAKAADEASAMRAVLDKIDSER
jgi:hypothetical protein